ncbi:alkylhydroperoxidase family enzyme [Paraburkholderia sp. GAS448]|jgi:alkylhydroperoxidase family enzyme|uniref:hypothetical protein n=1 Tax=Paraburkholderia sp. GAS448 TaxID=3035136 RepID=UPI003D19A83B
MLDMEVPAGHALRPRARLCAAADFQALRCSVLTTLMQTRGKVSGADLETVRAAGFTDANIVEIIALSAQFMLTNFVNHAFESGIDFPAVEAEVA